MALRPDQASEAMPAGVELLLDEQPEGGPGAVLEQAWQRYPGQAWLVLACDMPGIEVETLRSLIAARSPGAYATAFIDPVTEWPTPLCAIWEPRAAVEFRSRNGRSRGPRKVMQRVAIHAISPVNPAWLFHANTPEDQQRWEGLNE